VGCIPLKKLVYKWLTAMHPGGKYVTKQMIIRKGKCFMMK
jgi:hypothetical protein